MEEILFKKYGECSVTITGKSSQVITDGWKEFKVDTVIFDINTGAYLTVEVGCYGVYDRAKYFVGIKPDCCDYFKFQGSEKGLILNVFAGGGCNLEGEAMGIVFSLLSDLFLHPELLQDCLKKITAKTGKLETFTSYLKESLELYEHNKSYRGISELSKKYHTTPISKEKFVECGFKRTAKYVDEIISDKEYCQKVYDFVRDKSGCMDAPVYSVGNLSVEDKCYAF